MIRSLPRSRPAFTLIELLIVILIIALLLGILLPTLAGARERARRLKDSTNVRAIAQAMTVWSGSSAGAYPLPSRVDLSDATVSRGGNPAFVKDNIGNVVSLLIYNNLLTVEQCRSPLEVNANIQTDYFYEHAAPQKAVRPDSALWDPGFCSFPGEQNSYTGVGLGRRDPNVGNLSYAMIPPHGARLERFAGTFDPRSVLVGTRGPRYLGQPGEWTLTPNQNGIGSNRLKFFAPKNAWQGNLAFADGSVDFFTRPDPDEIPIVFQAAGGGAVPGRAYGDNVFVNESDVTGALESYSQPRDNRNAYIVMFADVREATENNERYTTIQAMPD
ncbi:MAG: prepilin-type N-terminal cleavage/methylation domain-containing protein [Phycisphaeraceae bacterium]|nr:prepilin-type N-terminal cleavage/methylation domain-containing protein [Phycisphaeraceae bacterium]